MGLSHRSNIEDDSYRCRQCISSPLCRSLLVTASFYYLAGYSELSVASPSSGPWSWYFRNLHALQHPCPDHFQSSSPTLGGSLRCIFLIIARPPPELIVFVVRPHPWFICTPNYRTFRLAILRMSLILHFIELWHIFCSATAPLISLAIFARPFAPTWPWAYPLLTQHSPVVFLLHRMLLVIAVTDPESLCFSFENTYICWHTIM